MVDATREEEKRSEAFLQMIALSVSGAKGEKIYTSDTIDWSKVIRYGRYAENARQDAGIIAHTPIYSKALRKSPAEFFAAIKSGRRFASQHAVVFLSNVIHHSTTMSEDDCHAKCCEKQYIYSRILLILSPQKREIALNNV